MGSTKEAIAKSLAHAIEVGIAGGIVLFAVYMFREDAEIMTAIKDAIKVIIPVALGAFVPKFARAHTGIPLGDYVNER